MRKQRVASKNFLFILSFLCLYLLFTIFPFIRGIFMSFFDWSLLKGQDFIGFANYSRVLIDADFYRSLFTTIKFVVLSTIPLVILGFVMALIVSRKMKYIGALRTIFFIPNILSVSVVAIIWSGVLGGYGSLVNSILSLFKMDTIYFFKDEKLAWFSIILITIWWTVGFNMLIFLAALQNIPSYVYEAAQIDGSSGLNTVFKITIPQLKETFKMVVFLQIMSSFKVFAQIYLVTKGGPAGATKPIMQYLYEDGMSSYQFGYASAISVIFFIILLFVAILQMFFNRKQEEEV